MPKQVTIHSQHLDAFCRKYQSRIHRGQTPVYRYDAPALGKTAFYDQHMTYTTYAVDSVDISMPEDKFRDLLDILSEVDDPRGDYRIFSRETEARGVGWLREVLENDRLYRAEKWERRDNPVVQKAYEKYQMLLSLTRG